ncbi:Thermostable carboxypeptidase 1 [Pseudoalteromonas luteoviolacea B = ATCC 29581]|nr:Thermostable carboxypeptidase 1 [Pseudoalteromonas luteoviolacea B = ATCC 29581]
MSAIAHLKSHYEKLDNFEHIFAITRWDEAACMPAGGAEARGEAHSELAVHIHRLATNPEVKAWLEQASLENVSDKDQAFVREAMRHYEAMVALPESLVSAKTKAGSRCEVAWRSQRKNNDWTGFVKNFKPVVELAREEAQIRAKGRQSPYDAMMALYEPGMTSQQVDSVFNDLKTWLPATIERVLEKQVSQNRSIPPLETTIPVFEQQKLSKALMQLLRFDFTRGRLDVSAHPFCGGVPDDVRLTTRYNENDFIPAMMGVIHETGHARYEQMLPNSLKRFPVGKARSMGIHESQSLFFEMQLARDSQFIPVLYRQVCEKLGCFLPEKYTESHFKQEVQKVERGFIRVDADEVTYPAHVILRYEIEKALINSEIEIEDIPELWDSKMQAYLGLSTKGNFKDGCMQDIHWTDGSFGYFPSYTLGAMYAAQFRAKMSQEFDLSNCIKSGNIELIETWLDRNIWQHGSVFETNDLVLKATGESLNAKFFKAHIEQRYLK